MEIAWAVYQRYASHVFDSMPASVWNTQMNGADRLNALLTGFCDYYFKRPQGAQYVADFNRIYGDNAEVAMIRMANPIRAKGNDPLTTLVELGIRDGSLRPVLVPTLIRAMILTVLHGLEQRMLQFGNEITSEYGHALKDIYACTVEIMMQGLRANAGVAA